MFHDGFIVLSVGQEESLLRLELLGRRPRGRAQRQIYGRSGRGRELVGVKEEDAEDRDRWRQMIGCCQPPLEGTSPEEKITVIFIKHLLKGIYTKLTVGVGITNILMPILSL